MRSSAHSETSPAASQPASRTSTTRAPSARRSGTFGSPGRSSSSWPGTSPSPARRRQVEETTRAALARLAPLRDSLRTGVIHGDVTDDNIVVDPSDPDAPAGVIDFGDVSRGWLVAELAVAVASALHHVPTDPLRVLETIDAFAAHVPLTDAEIAALWPLVVLRAAVLVVSGEQQVAVDADNTYADENRAHEWLVFAVARRIDPDEAESLIRWRLQQHDPASGRRWHSAASSVSTSMRRMCSTCR